MVSSSLEGNRKPKILMKSPWEFLQRPIGSGGLISLLSSQESLLDQLSETGVEYIEVPDNTREMIERLFLPSCFTGLISSFSSSLHRFFFHYFDRFARLVKKEMMVRSFLALLIRAKQMLGFESSKISRRKKILT